MKQNKKAIWNGTLSILLSAVVLAVVIALNLLVGQLPASFLRPDTSPEGLLTISDGTRNVAAALDADVTLYHVTQPDNADPMVTELLARYAELSSHIKVETVDPVTNPTFAAKYAQSGTLSENSVVAVSRERSTVADGSSLYKYRLPGDELNYYSEEEYNYYYEYYAMYYGQHLSATRYFFGENAVTRAIDYVSAKDLPVLYQLTGHGETAPGDIMLSTLADENVELKELTLISEAAAGGVPEDAAAVLVNAPQMDLSEEEVKLLISYIDRGGNVLLTTDYLHCTAEAVPNLAALTSYMGLSGIGDVVLEGDENRYYPGNPYIIFPTVKEGGMNALLQSTNITPYLYACHPIVQSEEDETVNAVPLLTTSEKAFLLADMQAQVDAGKEDLTLDDLPTSSLAVGWQSTREGGGTLCWFGAPQLFDDSFLGANAPLLAAYLQSACEKPAAVSIVGKEIASSALNVTEGNRNLWLAVFVVAVPIVPLAIGFAVWFRRRRK